MSARSNVLAAPVLAALVLAGAALYGPQAAARELAPGESAAFNAWVRIVQSRLIRSVTRAHGFPRNARVIVSFSVKRDGRVSGIHAISSSDPDPRYPRLSERVVGLGGPFPPVPAGHDAPVHFAVPLRFDATPHGRHRRGQRAG